MKHDIVKRGAKNFYCTVCQQSWQAESKASCPGLPVYGHGAWGDLLTKNHLSAKGYSVTGKVLPKPVGCYRGMDDYVMLYDPAQATPKRVSHRPRATYYLETVFWPAPMLVPLEQIVVLEGGDPKPHHHEIMSHRRDLAEMAIYLGCFSEAEVNAFTDGALLILRPAMTVHRRYQEWGNEEERRKLGERIIEAYRRWRWQPKPMDAAVSEFRKMQREKKDAAVRAMHAQMSVALRAREPKRLLEEVDGPVVQRSLFDEAEV